MEDTLKNMNEILSRIELKAADMAERIANIDKRLQILMDEIDKNRSGIPSNRTMTTTYDGDIMFKYKQNGK